ncbi:MAG: SGNH/GDSL hydrolase family protein [Oscillospiraceae bacterium]|nr:SGNH/GDSL hydrolase family protein [Oscillospiraceae bacterium]
MKKILSSILAAAMLLTFTACGGSSGGSNSTDTSTDTSSDTSTSEISDNGSSTDTPSTPDNPVNDKPTLSDEATYNAMVERSLMTTGDMTRMANVLKKAENGEEITIAYIGGSITEGLTVAPAEPELCWAYLSHKWLCEKYPDTKINYVNAGLSGTPSILGNVRLERDVLAYDPDICFVEFAVNDGMEAQYRNSYESLVRTLLENENDIAVVLLFTVIESGHTCQPHMSEIGNNYGLPMISEPDSLGVEFSEGRMTWQEYSDDQSHPNERGHKIVRDFLAHYFETVMEKIDENTGTVDRTLPAAKYSDRFVNMHFIDSEKLEPELVGFDKDTAHSAFQNSWSYFDSVGASFKFTINCKSLELVYKANKSKAYAEAEIYIDGEQTTTVNAYQRDGWENPVTALIIDNDEAAEHTVEIKIAGENKRYFAILGFGYCD